MITLNTNLASLIVQSNLQKSTNALNTAIERVYGTTEYNGIKLYGEPQKFMEDIERIDTSGFTKLSSVSTSTSISSGTFSISTAEELAQLATMTNDGKITGGTFVLANDIDLSAYSSGEGWTPIGKYCNEFQGAFDGNGYVISNLYINRPDASEQGLFGWIYNSEIRNLGLENVNITGLESVGAIVGNSEGDITNCYSTGNLKAGSNVGGLVGLNDGSAITNSYSTCDVTGDYNLGGLVGVSDYSFAMLNNTYATGKVTGDHDLGGLVGSSDGKIMNSYTTGDVIGNSLVGGLVGGLCFGNAAEIQNSYATGNVTGNNKTNDLVGWNKDTGSSLGNMLDLSNGVPFSYEREPKPVNICFQVGIDSSEFSSIIINTAFGIDVSTLRNIGNGVNQLAKIDSLLNNVSAKQTQYGAVQNRLESALEEISTQYDNLVSSRSTLRDADIAEVSSEYIRQQILQQASATLLATANQSPALALQLI